MRAAMFLALAACGFPQPQRIGSGDAAHDVLVRKDAAADAPPPFGSCVALPNNCGPGGTANCCATNAVPGGTFDRGYDKAGAGDMSSPATVSAFRLDTYEVTVGRFRVFAGNAQGTQAHPPGAGSGAHPNLANSGWDSAWNSLLPTDENALHAALKCDASYQTWTDTQGANDALPIDCVSWYEAMAFCIWDGGYLPTEAEWNFAAAGGSNQRAYPWSSPASSTTIDCSHANYTDTGCTPTGANRVGSESPTGDGLYGQSDLAGNVWEWVLDYNGAYPTPCSDCANLTSAAQRVIRGGNFQADALTLRTGSRSGLTPENHYFQAGFRCARPM